MREYTADDRKKFEQLRTKRLRTAEELDDPENEGIKRTLVDKYTDPAHFVYELLQNADDAGASEAKVELHHDKIVFIHNGGKHFTISPVESAEEDRKNGKGNYGDVNAITAIGASSKSKYENKIGKFGIGFKSVFTYTESPEIYDDNYCFAIERLVVPKLIEEDYPGRKNGETVFSLPLNATEKTAADSFSEIRDKLENLVYPNLLLNNLKVISFDVIDAQDCEASGTYEKEVEDKQKFGNTRAEKVCYTFIKQVGVAQEESSEDFWFFTRSSEEGYSYSVGFFMKNGRLKQIKKPAFCFFATKQVTNLNFVIHAPFLLSDSREGIKAGEKHNRDMVDRLADLAADALVYLRDIGEANGEKLIDDGIVDIVPIDSGVFSKVGNSEDISFKPFYDKMLKKLQTERLIPTGSGYAYKKNAYWAEYSEATKVFGRKELAEICENPYAEWGFKSLSRKDEGTSSKRREYIDLITRTYLTDEALVGGREARILSNKRWIDIEPIKGIDENFTKKRSEDLDWLCKFYGWAASTRERIMEKVDRCKKAPIFLDCERKAARAFEGRVNRPILFLPSNDMNGKCRMILPELYDREETREIASRMGIEKPSLIDYIYNNMLETSKWTSMTEDEKRGLVPLAFKYWQKCSSIEQEKLVERIKETNYQFILGYSVADPLLKREKGEDLYYPDEELIRFFRPSPQIKFAAMQRYTEDMQLNEKNKRYLRNFLKEFGVNELPKVVNCAQPGVSGRTEQEFEIEGLKNAIQCITENRDVELSLVTWRFLCELNNNEESLLKVFKKITTSYIKGKGKTQSDTVDSSTCEMLRREKWLVDKTGEFKSPGSILSCDMDERYGAENPDAPTKALLDKLDIYDNESYAQLSIVTRRDLEMIREFRSRGYDLEKLLMDLERKQARKQERAERKNQELNIYDDDYDEQENFEQSNHGSRRINEKAETSHGDIENASVNLGYSRLPSGQEERKTQGDYRVSFGSGGTAGTSAAVFVMETDQNAAPAVRRANECDTYGAELSDEDVEREYKKRIAKRLRVKAKKENVESAENLVKGTQLVINEGINQNVDDCGEEENEGESFEKQDGDENLPKPVSIDDKIARAKRKSVRTLERLGRYSTLSDRLEDLEKGRKEYTFLWFKILLEMEELSKEEDTVDGREMAISFGEVRRDYETERTLVLKNPSRFVPQSVEELPELKLNLKLSGGRTREIELEAASVKSYELHVKMKSAEEVDGVDLSLVEKAVIKVLNPAFLLTELRKGFCELNLTDDYNMQANLTDKIEFVFGPPGTGKTTKLANETIRNFINSAGNGQKMLVLAPTNKAADVLVRKVMEQKNYSEPYPNWLIRFGTTNDEVIEKNEVYKNTEIDLDKYKRVVLVTTIARFPYDSLRNGYYLKDIKWNKIIIDEASMVSLASMVYVLYKNNTSDFVIAGDPFQIKPITAVEQWIDENIYTFVGLKSFKNTQTTPHLYRVTRCTEQYRSVPAIGNLFSEFKYDCMIKNKRNAPQLKLGIESILDCRTLNIIKFPVKRYESVYASKRLKEGSPYQPYSALFTYEFTCYLARLISKKNHGRLRLSIGVIAPYRAQADLVDKLVLGTNLPEEVSIRVGTIHSFQGDECDIVIALYNTPPNISGAPSVFLNKDEIINVSISRAKDYLFVVIPDDETEGIEKLKKLTKIKELMRKEKNEFREFSSSDIEKLMFSGKGSYIEDNAFATGHQSVNVYRLPEKCYEIRSADTAIDIQICER